MYTLDYDEQLDDYVARSLRDLDDAELEVHLQDNRRFVAFLEAEKASRTQDGGEA